MSAIVGFSFGWSSLAADYSCNLPETTSTYKVFGLTYLGLIIPQIGLELLGAAAMATFTSMPTWGEHFETEGVGGLIAAPLVHYMHGGGRFFSIIAGVSVTLTTCLCYCLIETVFPAIYRRQQYRKFDR